MCGIVGLHLRNPDLYPRLGELVSDMLGEMSDRGADSAGVAVYGDPRWSPAGRATVTVLEGSSAETVREVVAGATGVTPTVEHAGDVLVVNAELPVDDLVAAVLTAGGLIAGFGESVTVLKGVGRPRDLTAAWGLPAAQGWQAVGHTRMATESAVNAAGAHPYAVGPDQCMVHNGSFSNHATIRRELMARGVQFESENDTEVGARFIADALANGHSFDVALKDLNAQFDGFYTLLVSNADSLAVIRDAIACKPAVVAETDDWVAVASEYRALVSLPGVADARLFEPEPEEIYTWTR